MSNPTAERERTARKNAEAGARNFLFWPTNFVCLINDRKSDEAIAELTEFILRREANAVALAAAPQPPAPQPAEMPGLEQEVKQWFGKLLTGPNGEKGIFAADLLDLMQAVIRPAFEAVVAERDRERLAANAVAAVNCAKIETLESALSQSRSVQADLVKALRELADAYEWCVKNGWPKTPRPSNSPDEWSSHDAAISLLPTREKG